ncbi:MAG: hypothetical protein RMK67_02685 [Chloroflexota bacterium]|nr:hypothetical protein [Chloroflexota bacterium]
MRLLAAIGAGLVVALSVLALAASNTVPGTRAGDGGGAISGYNVTNVAYTLDSNPQNIQKVEFDLGAAASAVKVRLQSGGTWYNCTNTSGNHWSCSTTGQAVQPADELRVVATQ